MEHVTFSYDKLSQKPTLNDVSMTITKGKITAIVGVSGSGKTTLLKMILGFYHSDKGSIYIGNQDLADINKREWRKKCGMVMQDGLIFADTISKNIDPNSLRNNEYVMRKAAEMANIGEFIKQLPLRYGTKIGSDGHGLSLGQKQHILIARAICKNPDYIFLDEATNSLDANNEHDIMEHLGTFIKGRTAVIIAHRLSTVRTADNIVVIKQGSIVEQGTHEELIARYGIYYSLVRNQLSV